MEFGGFYSFDIYRSSSNLTVAGKDVKPLAVMSNQDRYWEEILPFDSTWMNLENIMLSELGQTPEGKDTA